MQITAGDGSVAFACGDVEAPLGWSNLAVAMVARRYFATEPGGPSERSGQGSKLHEPLTAGED